MKEFKPVDVDKVDLAFGGRMSVLLPAKEDIPKEFWGGHTKWNDLVSAIFFCGGKIIKKTPKEGIDGTKALNHIRAILGSFEPSHEHKDAGCAYLFSLWFDEFEFEKATPELVKELEKRANQHGQKK